MLPRQDYFTHSSERILQLAQQIAYKSQHETITIDHILLAMTRAPETNAYHALQDVDIVDSKLARFLKVLHPPNTNHPLRFRGVDLSDEIQDLFRLSLLDATVRRDDYIASAHLLIGMMRLRNDTVQSILDHFALEAKEVIKAAEFYLDHSVEVEKHRISVQMPTETELGCAEMLRQLVERIRK